MVIPEKTTVYLKDYDIHVNKYLTYANIQAIVNNVLENMAKPQLNKDGTVKKREDGSIVKQDSWSEYQKNIDIFVLLLTTDIKQEDLVKISHDTLLQSGVIDAVKANIVNYWQLEVAFDFTRSWDRIVAELSKILTDKLESLSQDIIKKE